MNMLANKLILGVRLKLLIVMVGFGQLLSLNSDIFAQTPYELRWPKERIILGAGVFAGMAGGLLVASVKPLTVEQVNALSRDNVNRFDRPATYNFSEAADDFSDVARNACLVLPATLFFSKKVRNDFRLISVMYLETLIFSNTLSLICKGGFKRTRPFVYNENVPLENKVKSQARLGFFSGHTTNAFAGAVFFAATFSDYFPDSPFKPLVWGGSLLLAGTVGYKRIEAGKHFRTDVIVGALVGSSIGYLIPRLHRRKIRSGLSAFPVYKDSQLQIGLNYSF